MTLADWLKTQGTTPTRFAREHRKPKMTVYRHAMGQRIPSREEMSFYVRVTDGAVMPNDFYGIIKKKANKARVEARA